MFWRVYQYCGGTLPYTSTNVWKWVETCFKCYQSVLFHLFFGLQRAKIKFHPAIVWSFLCNAGRRIRFWFSIQPLMFLFCVTQSHTVCLHLLVLYCNNNPSTCHPQLLFFIVVFGVVDLFIYLWILSVGWPNLMFELMLHVYWISSFCFYACCSKILEIQKRNCHYIAISLGPI